MGGATRLMTLLTIPFPPLRPSLFLFRRCLSTLSSFPVRPLTFSCPSKIKSHTRLNSFHSQAGNFSHGLQPNQKQQQRHDHPWPEWSHFLGILSNEQKLCAPEDNGILPEDAFVVYEKLPDDFVRASTSCLAFARARPNLLGVLSRGDIEAVVSNGTPFLFKSALDTARRMKAFLETDGHNVSEVDQASTVDLMKYILSYASNPTVSSDGNGLYSRELVDSSVRNLLHELGTVTCGAPSGYVPVSHNHLSGRQGVSPHIRQNIEMKRGDWICPKCNFMNFARNMKCLECDDPRPKRQLNGGEWECPQCNFFNYGRNMVCLRCDCRRPGVLLFNTMNSRSGLEYNGEYSYKTSIDTRLAENAEKAHHSFNNSSQLNNTTEINNAASCQACPEIMPHQRRYQTSEMDDGKNISVGDHETAMSDDRDQKTVSSKSRSPGENLQFSINSASEMDTQKIAKDQAEQPARWFKGMMELHDSKDLPSAASDDDFPEMMPLRKGENQFVVSKNKDRSLTSPKYKRQVAMDQANNTNFVPFVPFPPGYFARKDTEQSNGPKSPVKTMGDTSSSKVISETGRSIDSTLGMADTSIMQSKDYQQKSSANSQFSGEIVAPPAGSPIKSSTTAHSIDSNVRAVEYSEKENASQAATGGASSRQPGDENVRSGWTGKSLEGSAVKEPDPLDMSEEAKAERWFKRVAQIKDISELSQIPDEDFPSIMPMRKGVNRFVVSKRKTPLERRLTSQQYRRNLPIVRTDPVKRESDDS